MHGKVYIVGAHSRAQTLAVYLRYLFPDIKVEAYLYDNTESNPKKVGDTPVMQITDSMELHTEYPVYIGTRGIYHKQIIEHLKRMGFLNIYPVTVELDLELRNRYLEKYYAALGRTFYKIEKLEKKSASVYVVRSAMDQPLQQEYALAPYEKEIQAGAALVKSGMHMEILTDDTGEHISYRNRQFCELTALYWIWKHATEDIIGMVHYRRHFTIPEDWIERMLGSQIDVILPIPLYVVPDLEENYKARHDPGDWDYMMQCLKESGAQLHEEARVFFKGNLYSPCNMFIMRKEALDELCSWMFPVLFRVAEHGGQKEDVYKNRYPGFLSERLISFFFEKNRKKYKVVYADKNFLA